VKCPECGTWTVVLETRATDKNHVTRRRECANEHRFTTQEVAIPQEAIDEERRVNMLNNLKRLESIREGRPPRVRKSNARIY
jgi:transcriptional regulator NrdR family protein